MRRARQPVGGVLRGLVHLLEPLADRAVDLFARQMPPGDQRVFADPAVRLMFTEDLLLGSRRNMQALCLDVVMFGRHWGFELADIEVPVHLFYGDADVIVPRAPRRAHGASASRARGSASARAKATSAGSAPRTRSSTRSSAHWPDEAHAAEPTHGAELPHVQLP